MRLLVLLLLKAIAISVLRSATSQDLFNAELLTSGNMLHDAVKALTHSYVVKSIEIVIVV